VPYHPGYNRVPEHKGKMEGNMSVRVHVATINLHSDVIAKEQVTEQEDPLSTW